MSKIHIDIVKVLLMKKPPTVEQGVNLGNNIKI
jgi:hypothetical protein